MIGGTNLKRLILVFCCIALIVSSLSGCNSEMLIADHDKYDLIKKGKDCYLVIDESMIESLEAIDVYLGSIEFNSIDELIDIVKNGKLDDSQLAIAYKAFIKDSNGIEMFDLSNMQVPVLPDEFEYQNVYWKGTRYSFHLASSKEEYGYCYYLSKEEYDRDYERNYLNFFDQEYITLEKTVKNKNKTEYYYSTKAGEFKRGRYTVKNGKTTLIVDEEYFLSAKSQLLEDRPVSDTIPYSVQIYGRKSNHYFKIYLYNLVEQPTEEWIKSFGIKDYE